MTQKVLPELLELDKLEGKPLDLLRKTLDVLGAQYETPKPKEGEGVVRTYKEIYLEPFLESDSVIFSQAIGTHTLILAIEQLSKVDCISFRIQLNEGKRLVSASDLINDPGVIEDKTAGRILVAVKAGSRNLRLHFETTPGNKVGQCSCSTTLTNCLLKEAPLDQTLDIYFFYKVEASFFGYLKGRISIWKF